MTQDAGFRCSPPPCTVHPRPPSPPRPRACSLSSCFQIGPRDAAHLRPCLPLLSLSVSPHGCVTGGPGVCPGWGAGGGGPLQVTSDHDGATSSPPPPPPPPARKPSKAPRETLDPESTACVLSLGLRDECGRGCRAAQGRSTSVLTSSSEAAPPEGSGHQTFCDLSFLPETGGNLPWQDLGWTE